MQSDLNFVIEYTDGVKHSIVDAARVQNWVHEFWKRYGDFDVDKIYITLDVMAADRPKTIDGEVVDGDVLYCRGSQAWVPHLLGMVDPELLGTLGRSSLITLYIDPESTVSEAQLIQTLWHELGHARQCAHELLECRKGMWYWKDSPWHSTTDVHDCYDTYHNAPWEEDARCYGAEAELYYLKKEYQRDPIMWLTLAAPALMLAEWMHRRKRK